MTSSQKNPRNLARQIAVQRRNLVAVCRLAVKSLIEHSCFEPIEDGGEELHNFCAIMEHILSHRLRPQQTWYGVEEPRPFWDFVRAACRGIPHSCIASLEAVEKPKTARGKGRAWIRTALMEKKLHDYFTYAVQQTRITRSFYSDGAILLSDDSNLLSGVLLGLNAIDFSFDIRGENLDQPSVPVVDFTPYLKFEQIRDFLHDEHRDLRDLGRLMSVSLDSDVFIDENSDTWRARYLKVDAKFRVVSEQKGYLEELVRLRESQLEEHHRQRQRLLETLHHYEAESRRERQQLEAVIIELQAQLGNVKEEHRLKLQQMQMLLHRYTTQLPTFDPPEIALREMTVLPLLARPSASQQSWSGNELTVTSTVPTIPTSRPQTADSKSLISMTSSVSFASRHDTQSMVPLPGSLTSHTSYLCGDDLPAQPQHLPPAPTNEQLATDHVAEDGQPPLVGRGTRRRVSGGSSAYSSPIIRQGHVTEDQDPEEGEGPSRHKGAAPVVSLDTPHLEDRLGYGDGSGSGSADEEIIIVVDRDAPKPDLVTSCDSTFESERDSDPDKAPSKQTSADDVEALPEDEGSSAGGAAPPAGGGPQEAAVGTN